MENELGVLLETLRGKMSLREAAEKSGLSHTYIRDVERGYNRSTKASVKPSPDTLRRLASAYNYSYEDLMKMAGYLHESAAVDSVSSKRIEDISLDDLHAELETDEEFQRFRENATQEEWDHFKQTVKALARGLKKK